MLKEKTIEITISLNIGSIESPSYESTTLTGLRMRVAVLGGTMSSQGQLQCSILGLSPELMAKITVTGFIRQENRNNKIMVAAGNEGEQLTVVYEGVIAEAYANIQQPLSEINIIALSAMGAAIKPVGATSYKGSQQVSDIMADLADTAGFRLDNVDVRKTLNNTYLVGTVWDKIKRCANAAGILYSINNNVLSIWDDGKEVSESVIISSDSGNIPQLVGTPKAGGSGLSVRTLFYPSFEFSKSYEVKSKDFPLANGKWSPTSIIHSLESRVDDGAWFTDVEFKRAL